MKIFYIRCYSGDKQYSQKMDRTSLDIVLQGKKKKKILHSLEQENTDYKSSW